MEKKRKNFPTKCSNLSHCWAHSQNKGLSEYQRKASQQRTSSGPAHPPPEAEKQAGEGQSRKARGNLDPRGGILVEYAITGAKIAPHLPALAAAHLPLCLQQGERPVCSWLALLWYLLSPLFCEQDWQCLRLELFAGKSSLSFSFSLAIPHFGLLSHVRSSGHSGPVLTLSMQPTPPCSAPTLWWQTPNSAGSCS